MLYVRLPSNRSAILGNNRNKAKFIRLKMCVIYTIEIFDRICKEILDVAPVALRTLYIPRCSFFKAGVSLIGRVSTHIRRQASA